MKATRLAIPDVVLLGPKVFGDGRFFYESYNRDAFCEATGLDPHFVQDNHSCSAKNVLRGLYYQLPPKAQGKLVRVVVGEVFDVAVDIRKGSPTFGKWVSEILSAENMRQLWIPKAFAHGFLVLSEMAEFLCKTTDCYSPEHERSIRWDDPEIGVKWPLGGCPVISAKDAAGLPFTEADAFFDSNN